MQFADRVHRHFFNEGALTPNSALGLFTELAEAMDHLLQVVHGKHLQPGEAQDAYWRGQSALMAMDLLSQMGKPKEALELYHSLTNDFPAMKIGLEERKQRILDQSAQPK